MINLVYDPRNLLLFADNVLLKDYWTRMEFFFKLLFKLFPAHTATLFESFEDNITKMFQDQLKVCPVTDTWNSRLLLSKVCPFSLLSGSVSINKCVLFVVYRWADRWRTNVTVSAFCSTICSVLTAGNLLLVAAMKLSWQIRAVVAALYFVKNN